MADNISILDGTSATKVVRSTDNAGVHTPHSDAELWVNGAAVDTSNPVPVRAGVAAADLGKAEDAAHTSGDVGVMALAVRNDAGTALAGTTGDYIPFSTDSTGALRVTTAGGGGGTTQYLEDAASAGGESLTLAGAVRQDTPASSASADGDYATLKVDSLGRLHVNRAGAANYANGRVTASTGAATLLAARATRRSVTFKNEDAAITVYIGAATVSSSNGMALLAGESITLEITTLIQVISASGSPVVSYIETYD